MKTIYKYEFEEEMDTPVGAKLIKLGYQGSTLYGWYLVDLEEFNITTVYYEIYGTGQPITSNQAKFYVDTVFHPNGLVWHIFEYCHNE